MYFFVPNPLYHNDSYNLSFNGCFEHYLALTLQHGYASWSHRQYLRSLILPELPASATRPSPASLSPSHTTHAMANLARGRLYPKHSYHLSKMIRNLGEP
jgi:hypothetical protein